MKAVSPDSHSFPGDHFWLPYFFTSFSLVVATQLDERSAQLLSATCYNANVPLILVTSYGFLGHVRNIVPEHCILESKPEPAPLEDLRLANPWPELLEYALSFNIETLEPHEHSHVPYVIVLLQLAQVWKNAHNNSLAKSRHEKEEFKKMIKEASMDYQRRIFSNKQQHDLTAIAAETARWIAFYQYLRRGCSRWEADSNRAAKWRDQRDK